MTLLLCLLSFLSGCIITAFYFAKNYSGEILIDVTKLDIESGNAYFDLNCELDEISKKKYILIGVKHQEIR